MINIESVLKIIDNTGGKTGKCLKIYNKSNKQVGKLNNIILITVKNMRKNFKNKKIQKKKMYKAILVRVKKKNQRYDGSSIRFHENSIVLLKEDGLIKKNYKPLGSRIYGPVSVELRNNLAQNLKVISLSSKTI
jgi:large subunit ribosomal protein L14